MTPRRRKLALLASLLVWASLVITTRALPRDSKRSQPSGVIIHEAGSRKSSSGAVGGAASRDPPASPVKLFMPDEFQFYTLNNDGQLVRKQMTKQQIQGMIANGGPGTGMPVDLGLHHHHHHHQELGPEPKVSDIVQNVQKVLKEELTKPIKIQSSGSSIPGNVNSQWTNMLPYILSGGSADQEYSAQDSSIVLPTSDNDQYVDVIPLESARPADDQYESRPNYAPEQLVFDEKENKLVSRRPVYGSSQRPSLLGNMHLDQDIIDGHNTYTPPTRTKPAIPAKPTTTTVSYKITMTRPTPSSGWKGDAPAKNDSSEGKPTLYIPLSVSSSLLADSQNKDNFDLDFQILSGLKPRPSYSNLISTQLPQYGASSTMTTRFPTRTTTKSYDDSPKPTRISIPSIPTERISTPTTPRADQQKVTTLSGSSTPSPDSLTKLTDQNTLDPLKNMEPLYSHDRPEMSKKPSPTHRPIPGKPTFSSSVNLDVTSSVRPVYESTTKSSSTQTYHAIHQAQTQSTKDIFSSTYRPVYQPPTTTGTQKPSYRPESKITQVLLEVTPSLYPIYQGLPTHDADIETYTREKDPTSSTPALFPVKTENERTRTTESAQMLTSSTTEKAQEILRDTEKPDIVSTAQDHEKFTNNSTTLLPIPQNDLLTTKTSERVEEKNSALNHDELTYSTIMNADIINESTRTTLPVEVVANGQGIESTTLQTDRESIVSTPESYRTEIPQPIQSENYAQSSHSELYTISQQGPTKDTDSSFKSTESTLIEFSEMTTSHLQTVDTVSPTKSNVSQDDEAGDADLQNPTQSWINTETTQSIPLSEILEEADSHHGVDQNESLTKVQNSNNQTESEILALSQEKIIASFATLEHREESNLGGPQHPISFDGQHKGEHLTESSSTSKEDIKSDLHKEKEESKTETLESIPMTESGLLIDKMSYDAQTEEITRIEQNDKNSAMQDHRIPASAENKLTNPDLELTVQPISLSTSSYVGQPVTESVASTNRDELTPPNILKGDEVSTIKVIPIYDDETSVYRVPSGNTDKISSLEQSTLKSETSTPRGTKIPPYSIPSKTTLYVKPFRKESAHSEITTQASSIPESPLPGLGEALNNYMREYYVSKMPTDTFPTVIYKSSVTDDDLFGNEGGLSSTDSSLITKKPFSSLDSSLMDSNHNGLGSLDYQFKSSQNADDIVSLEDEQTLSPTMDSIVPEIPASTIVPYDESFDASRLGSETNDNSKVETPIIYLDLTSPSPSEKIKTQKPGQDSLTNSSLTRIKTKLPIEDVDKFLAQTGLLQEQDIPPTESYTLPSEYIPPNHIASGMIAGYPTYNHYDPSSSPSLVSNPTNPTIETKLENTVPETTSEATYGTMVTDKNSTMGEFISSTQIVGEDSKKTITESTSNSQIETSTMNEVPDQISEINNYETHTRVTLEPFPAEGDLEKSSTVESTKEEVNTPFNTPLEKISDIINQLKISPTELEKGSYDFSNGLQTTIFPSAEFESMIKANSPTTEDYSLTTIFENLGRTSDDTLEEEQTSISNHTSDGQPTTVRPLDPIPTVRGITRVKTTIPSETATTSTATADVAVTQEPTTERPVVVSTVSTTKGPIEKVQSTIDKSAGRIHLEDEKVKVPVKPTESSIKFSMKTRGHYPTRRTPVEGQKISQPYTRRPSRPNSKGTSTTPSTKTTVTESISAKILATKRSTVKPGMESEENDTEGLTTLQPLTNIDEQMEDEKKQPINLKEEFNELSSEPVKLEHSTGAIGLDQSSAGQDKDVAEFLDMCNELSFKFWSYSNTGLSSSRSVTLSPFGMISTLAMIFLGARGLTSNQMNDILKLDDVVTFNPHLVFQNITDTVTLARGQGIENAAFVRALFADRLKVRRIIPFYKEQAQQFYEGAVVDINFSTAGDILRRRTNLLIRKQTGGRIKDFMKTHIISLHSPLTALSANVFQTSCDGSEASVEGRDGEMYFAVAQTVKQRKLMPIPAVVWKSGVSAGYEPSLDATAVALGDAKRPVSMIMVMPGQQGVTASGDNLEKLETRLFNNPAENLNKLLKVIVPRKLEVQMPKFSHRSIVNVTAALKRMGFEQLFTRNADLKGINGAGHDLFLADMVQMNLFCTCSDDNKAGGRHLSETYPGTSSRQTRSWELNDSDSYKITNDNNSNNNNGLNNHVDKESSKLLGPKRDSSCEDDDETGVPMNSRQNASRNRLRWLSPTKRRLCRHRRQAESEKSRMRMDKPFLYFVRHNLSGLILHIGRFNPKNQS